MSGHLFLFANAKKKQAENPALGRLGPLVLRKKIRARLFSAGRRSCRVLGAQAVQVNSKDLVGLGIVAEIDKLFELEAEAKAAGLGAGERMELRMEEAEPSLKVSRSELIGQSVDVPTQRSGQSMQLHLGPLGSAEALSGLRSTGALKQFSGKRYPPGSGRLQKLLYVGRERAGPRVAATVLRDGKENDWFHQFLSRCTVKVAKEYV